MFLLPHWLCRVSNICCFLQSAALEKIKTNCRYSKFDTSKLMCYQEHDFLKSVQLKETILDYIVSSNFRWLNQRLLNLNLPYNYVPHTFSNKSYRIHEISFDLCPESTFETGFNSGQHQTYMEYYKNQYGIEIRDKKQPLLIHRMKRSELPDGKNDFIFYALSF